MSKQRIFYSILFTLVVLLFVKLILNQRERAPEMTDLSRTTPTANTPPAKRESTPQPVSLPRVAPPSKLPKEIEAGSRQWRLEFSDKSLPDETRQRISYDLSLVFGHLPRFEVDVLAYPIEAVGKQLDRRVRFEGGSRKWNNVLQSDEFGCLFRSAKVEELYVPEQVIAAYVEAINMEKQNQAAYQQLDQFLARMNELKERPVENVRDLFVVADDFKMAEGNLSAISAAEFAEGWGGKHYREPSILDVASTASTPLQKYGSLKATTYA